VRIVLVVCDYYGIIMWFRCYYMGVGVVCVYYVLTIIHIPHTYDSSVYVVCE